jgi:hypothetical protein
MTGTIPLATRRPACGGAFNFDDRKVAHHVDISRKRIPARRFRHSGPEQRK